MKSSELTVEQKAKIKNANMAGWNEPLKKFLSFEEINKSIQEWFNEPQSDDRNN